MNRFYWATVIAVFVTVYLATDLMLAGMSGGAASSLAVRARLRRLSRRLKHAADLGVAAMLARRERHVTLYTLHVAGRDAAEGRLQ